MFSVFSLIFLIAHYVDYGRDGVANDKTKLTGEVLQAIADGAFLLMIILMAKGYTITR